jgi:hypothetical protein
MFCIVCGFYPLIVFLDGNRKSNFALRGINLSTCCGPKLFMDVLEATASRATPIDEFWSSLSTDLYMASRHNLSMPELDANALAPIIDAHCRSSPGSLCLSLDHRVLCRFHESFRRATRLPIPG